MTYAALFRLATAGSFLSALLSGCGWVDEGVDGNEPPTAEDADYSVTVGERIEIEAPGVLSKAADPGGRSLTAAKHSDPQHAESFTLEADGSFVYQHDGGRSTTDSFEFVANDGIDDSEPTEVTIHIRQYPTVTDQSYEAVPGQARKIAAPGVLQGAEDLNGDPLTARLVGGQSTAHGQITLNEDGSFTYKAAVTAMGEDSFRFYASDGTLASDPATATIMLSPLAKPNAMDDEFEIDAGGNVALAAPGVLENDSSPHGGTLTAQLIAPPAHAARFELQPNGAFVYEHNRSIDAVDTFTYRAIDLIASEPATVTIVINQPPTAQDDGPYAAVRGVALKVGADQGVLANDSDPNGEPLQAELEAAPTQGTLALAGDGSFTYTPDAGASGTVTFTYRARDKSLASQPATVTIEVAPEETEDPAAEPVEEGETL